MKNIIKRHFIILLLISGLLLPQIGNACMDWDDADSWSIDDWDDFVSSGDAYDFYGIDGHVIDDDNPNDPNDFLSTDEDDLIYALEQLYNIYGEETTNLILNANTSIEIDGIYIERENTLGETYTEFVPYGEPYANITFNDTDGDGVLDYLDVNGFTDNFSDTDGDGVADYWDDNPEQPWWEIYGTLEDYISVMQTEGIFDDEFIVDLDDDISTSGNPYYAPNYDDDIVDNGIYSEPIEDPNCSELSIQNALAVSNLFNQKDEYNNPIFKTNFDALKNASKTTTENIFAIGKDAVGNYSQDVMIQMGGDFSVSSVDFPDMIATAHNHPTNVFSCFSIGDLYALASENKTRSDFTTIYVVGEKETYALKITDADKLEAFYDSHPSNVFLDNETGMFKKDQRDASGVDLEANFKGMYDLLQKYNPDKLSPEDAFAHTFAFTLSNNDIGVSIFKAEENTDGTLNFKEIRTSAIFNSTLNETILTATKCK